MHPFSADPALAAPVNAISLRPLDALTLALFE
jgi:hypothetical protein